MKPKANILISKSNMKKSCINIIQPKIIKHNIKLNITNHVIKDPNFQTLILNIIL